MLNEVHDYEKMCARRTFEFALQNIRLGLVRYGRNARTVLETYPQDGYVDALDTALKIGYRICFDRVLEIISSPSGTWNKLSEAVKTEIIREAEEMIMRFNYPRSELDNALQKTEIMIEK